ncbi:hypothetical protein BAUCODRAFT_127081 [Baudoinia panamericana UAMH 10762]|uniref:F-box domain-containing protein n=1 Tax=Baudoinia panamericana (strain UAMH 10762) TaxID=717646 RepID=M2LBE7_BAUPA|nr:uncharacterized protein BAUCODRAFT_127081 [Baudoinia panamericana UAMH 10762]EMC91162.1 hypothetical protein BAUCODRAFT_127081 [Baudoinia panamericana UAMH 10762]
MAHVQEHLQREGRACYKRHEYARALELFDRAIGRAESVHLLDNRAACYEKLNSLPAALKDAKQAIQLQPQDATGYLRAGKVLVKMEKHSVALGLYTYGLKSIRHQGQGYELLRKAHTVLQHQLAPPRSVDPLAVLPRELAEFILEHLNFQQRINACLVSMQWTHFIRSTPSLWSHVDLSVARRKVRNDFISRAINIGRAKIKAATLNNLLDANRALSALLQHCPLQELTLLGTGILDAGLLNSLSKAKHLRSLRVAKDTEMGNTTWTALLRTLNPAMEALHVTLRGFSVSSIPMPYKHLHTISIDAMLYDQAFWDKISTSLPNLRSLTAHQSPMNRLTERCGVDLTEMSRLETVDLRLNHLDLDLLRLPPTVLYLRLSSHQYTWFGGNSNSIGDLPRLQELKLDFAPAVPLALVNSFLAISDGNCGAKPSELRNVTFTLVDSGGKEETILMLLEHARLRNLREFALHGGMVADATCSSICDKLPHLARLNLSDTSVTGVGVKSVTGLRNLKELVLNNCPQVGRDAVQWTRTQGIRVQSRNAPTQAGGHKVRY